MSIFFTATVLGAVGGGAYYFARGRTAAEGRAWVGQSVKAWRSKELDGDRFEVHMEETKLADMFTTFDHDGFDPYYSSDGIERRIEGTLKTSVPKKVIDSVELVTVRVVRAGESAKPKIDQRLASWKAALKRRTDEDQ